MIFPWAPQRWTVDDWRDGRIAIQEQLDKHYDDVALEVTGNLSNIQKQHYAKMVCDRLNSLVGAITVEGEVLLSREDSGMALIAEGIEHEPGQESGLFVRIQSWDETKEHPLLSSLDGKTVRITIEVLNA